MSISNFALVNSETNMVENTIVAEPTFIVEGCYLIEISQSKPASTGMLYNKESDSFGWPA